MILEKYTPFLVIIIQRAMLSDAVSQTHWETAIYTEDTWHYFVGTSAPPTNWNELDFDESNWSSGNIYPYCNYWESRSRKKLDRGLNQSVQYNTHVRNRGLMCFEK